MKMLNVWYVLTQVCLISYILSGLLVLRAIFISSKAVSFPKSPKIQPVMSKIIYDTHCKAYLVLLIVIEHSIFNTTISSNNLKQINKKSLRNNTSFIWQFSRKHSFVLFVSNVSVQHGAFNSGDTRELKLSHERKR